MKLFLVLVLTATTFSSAFSQTANTSQAREREAFLALERAAQYLSKQDLSCRNVADCQVLEIGSKACGGPQKYLISSKANLNFSQIETLSDLTVKREDQYNDRYNVQSDCLALMPPKVNCISKLCTPIHH